MATDNLTTNTVPLGEAGTGAAYLLPNSSAISNIGNWIDENSQKQAQREAQKRQQAQQLAAAWKANQLDIKGGTLFQPEINSRAAKVMQMGMDLQKSGVNPNLPSTDPQTSQLVQQYQSQRAGLMSDAEARDNIVKQSEANEKLLSAQAPGYYDPQSVQDYHDYISGKIPLSEITGKGLQMPELKKQFDLQPFVDKIQGVPIETTGTNPLTGVKTKMVLPNEAAHTQLANGLVNNNPEVRADVANKAGLPFDQIGTQTDPAVIKKQLDGFWRSAPNQAALVKAGISSYADPKYDQMINGQAKQMATAAQVKSNYINGIKTQLDNKVHMTDDKSWDFAYQNEQRARRRMGMEDQKFSQWKEDQQNEAGQFTVGNQNSYVPVIKDWVNKDVDHLDSNGNKVAAGAEPEQGASLYGVNLPAVKTVVRPSLVTNMKTGRTIKNTSPLNVDISQIQMVPVFKGLDASDPRNGSEISARQLKEMVSGTNKVGGLKNITFQPYAYGIQHLKDANNIHTADIPVKFSYDALKGSNVKKINTSTFDEATQGLKTLQANPKFRAMSPQDQLDFISQRYNLKLDQ